MQADTTNKKIKRYLTKGLISTIPKTSMSRELFCKKKYFTFWSLLVAAILKLTVTLVGKDESPPSHQFVITIFYRMFIGESD